MQKISPVKQRIFAFVDHLGISKRDFYGKTGISRGTLESSTGITEETVAKFIATYDVNIEWLITGRGEMFRTTKDASCQSDPTDKKLVDAQQKIIAMLEAENDRLKKELETKSVNRVLPADLEYGRKYEEHSRSGK